MSRESSPLICAYKLEWIPMHIFMRFENFDGDSPTSGNRGIQHTRYIYDMNLTWLAQPQQAT